VVSDPVAFPRFDPEPPARLLRVREAAARLHVHVNTVHRWIHAGKLVAIRWPNNHWRISEAAIRALLRE
jgi:excisionase family DNA binding protein